MRPRGEPIEKRRVNPVARPSTGALRPKKPFLVVAQDHMRFAVPEDLHDLVRKPVLPDAVAETDQFVDVAQTAQRFLQAGGVAMNVGDDTDFHARLVRGRRFRCNGPIEVEVIVSLSVKRPKEIYRSVLLVGTNETAARTDAW